MENENISIDECLSSYKPPIFWKDKEIVRQQINNWSLEKIHKLIIFTVSYTHLTLPTNREV